MIVARASLLMLLALGACGDTSSPLDDTRSTLDEAGTQAGATAAQAAPAPAPHAGEPDQAGTVDALAEAGSFGDGDGPPPLERAVEPRRDDHLRVLVLSGGGYHDFPGNLTRLLPGVGARLSVTCTELALHPKDTSSATSRQFLEEAELPAEFDAILAYTQGDLGLSESMKARLVAFVQGGGGLVGLHCAADSHPGWAAWDDLLRGRFESHPPFGDVQVSLVAEVSGHPVLAGLPRDWKLKDEFYHLKDCAPDDKTLLMSGVSPEGGAPRPVTWLREHGQGRVVYTILGHGPEVHGDARYQQLVAQALWWAAGRDGSPAPPR